MAKKDFIVPILALLIAIALIMHGPIAQDHIYHNFADQRKAFGIPNFLNVLTNLPFALVAFLGFRSASPMIEKRLKYMAGSLFAGFLVLTLGSGYYHLVPNNITLIFDRIPMSVIFMSFFAFIIYDRIDPYKGYAAFKILNIVGVLSIIYWGFTEYAGKGDLRLYAMIQFFPIVAIPLILSLYGSFFNHAREVVPIFILFGIAKFCEHYDKEIFYFLGNTISGHSLKHLFMAAAGCEIVLLMRRRAKWVYQHP